jgi:putative ABC transport system permease protein
VGSVTLVIAALTGLKDNVLGELETFGTNKVFILPERQRSGPISMMSWRRINLKHDELLDLLEHAPSLEAFTRMTSRMRPVRYGDTVEQMMVAGIDPAWHKVENRSVLMGRPFSLLDNEQGLPVCMIDAKTRDKLGLDRDPTGEDLLIDGRRFRVVGLVEPEPQLNFADGPPQYSLYVPYQTLWNMDPDWRAFNWAIGAARSPAVAAEAASEIRFFLRTRRHIARGDCRAIRPAVPKNRGRGNAGSRRRRGDQPDRRRRGDHEHHAGVGERADAGNWAAQGGGRAPRRGSDPVSD